MRLKLRGLWNYCLAYGVFQTPKGNTSSTVTIDVTVVHDGVTQPVISKTVRIRQFTKSHE